VLNSINKTGLIQVLLLIYIERVAAGFVQRLLDSIQEPGSRSAAHFCSVGLGQQVNGDLVAEFLVVTVHKSKAENVLSWSSWEFEFYRYIKFFVWLDALVLQAESVVDNDGSIDQLELHIHGPSNLSRVLEFASCTEVGSCDSNEFLRLVKACRLIDRLSSIKEWFKAEDLTQDAFKAKIAGFTVAVFGFLACPAIVTAVL